MQTDNTYFNNTLDGAALWPVGGIEDEVLWVRWKGRGGV